MQNPKLKIIIFSLFTFSLLIFNFSFLLITNPSFAQEEDPGQEPGVDLTSALSFITSMFNTISLSIGGAESAAMEGAVIDSEGSAKADTPLPLQLSISNPPQCFNNSPIVIPWTQSTNTAYYNVLRAETDFNPTGEVGTGLLGTYYDNKDLSQPIFSQVDPPGPSFIMNFGAVSPHTQINPDTFSIRWAGKIKPQVNGLHTFYLYGNDGYRLFIDETEVIGKWSTPAGGNPRETSGTITLDQAKYYNIRIEHYNYRFDSQLTFSWEAPGLTKQPVPKTALFPSYSTYKNPLVVSTQNTDPATPVLITNPITGEGDGIYAEYYDNTSHKPMGPANGVYQRIDPNIDFTWSSANPPFPSGAIPPNKYGVRWYGKVKTYNDGIYTFTIYTKGQVKFYVNDITQEIMKDLNQSPNPRTISGTIFLKGNQFYEFQLDYGHDDNSASGADSIIQLSWDGPGVPSPGIIPQNRLYHKENMNFPQGLFAQFYDNRDLFGTANKARFETPSTQPTFEYLWGSNPPVPEVGDNEISARFTGRLLAPVTGNYIFYAYAKDRIELTLNGVGVLNGSGAKTGSINLLKNAYYDFKLIYKNYTGDNNLTLEWEYPGQTRTFVPISVFSHSPFLQPISLEQGASGYYFNNKALAKDAKSLTGLTFSKNDLNTNSTSWGGALSPDQIIDPETFSIRWNGKFKTGLAGNYTFIARENDGIRLYADLDKTTAWLSDWSDTITTKTTSSTKNLPANKFFTFRFEYYNNLQPANVSLNWIKPGASTEEAIDYWHQKVDASYLSYEDKLYDPVTNPNGAVPETPYYYQVQAVGSGGITPSQWYFTQTGTCTSPPLKNPTVTCDPTTSLPMVKLDWDPPLIGNPTQYRIYRNTGSFGSCPNTLLTTIDQSQPEFASTSYDDKTVTTNTQYNYAVTAYNLAASPQETPITSCKSVFVPATSPCPPSAFVTLTDSCYTPSTWNTSLSATTSPNATSVQCQAVNVVTGALGSLSSVSGSPLTCNIPLTDLQAGNSYKIDVWANNDTSNKISSTLFSYQNVCIAPWIQTTGGDVHSNVKIDTPGGP